MSLDLICPHPWFYQPDLFVFDDIYSPTYPASARFCEWSHACLEMQLEELNNASYSGPALHYMGIFLEDDSNLARSQESLVAGKLMSGWWDTCQEAGSQRRPRTSFSEPTPTLDVLTIGEDSKCRNLSSKSFSRFQHYFL